jgi:hypothetical protein
LVALVNLFLWVPEHYNTHLRNFLPWTESKEAKAEEKAKDGEAAQNADKSTSASKIDGIAVVQHTVEEIQAVASGVQQQTARDETETGASTEASAEGEKPEAATTTQVVEKDDSTKRTDFFGFFAMLFERCCSPAKKKND